MDGQVMFRVEQAGFKVQCRLSTAAAQLVLDSSQGSTALPLLVVLTDTHGAQWDVTCLQPPNGPAYLTGPGWRSFAEANGLQLNDEVVLQQSADGASTLNIRVIHSLSVQDTLASEPARHQHMHQSGTATPATSMPTPANSATGAHAQPLPSASEDTGAAAQSRPLDDSLPPNKRQKTADGALAALGRALLSPASASAPLYPPTQPAGLSMQTGQALPPGLVPPSMQGMTPAAALAILTQLLAQQQQNAAAPYPPRDPRLALVAAGDQKHAFPLAASSAPLLPQQQPVPQHQMPARAQQQHAQPAWQQDRGPFGFKLSVPAQGCSASLDVPPAVADLLKPDGGSSTGVVLHFTIIDQTGQCWSVNLVEAAGRHALSTGWPALAAAWQLQAGDVLGCHADPQHPNTMAIAILNRAATMMPVASRPQIPPVYVRPPLRHSKVLLSVREGEYGVTVVLKAQSGVFGTALRLVKATGQLLFPGPEAQIIGQDLKKAAVTLIDPKGKTWDMTIMLRRYHSRKHATVIRQLQRWTPFATFWGLTEDDVLGFSLSLAGTDQITFHVAILSRAPGYEPPAAGKLSAGRSRASATGSKPRTVAMRAPICHVEAPFSLLPMRMSAQAVDGRPLRLPAYAMRALFPETVSDSAHQHLDVQASVAVQDVEGQAWDMKFSIKRSGAGNVARYVAGIGVWMRAWGCREGDSISFEADSLTPLELRVMITNRHAEKSAAAALAPTLSLNSNRSLHIPDIVAGPLGLKVVITSGMEAGRALRLSAKTGAYLFPELARNEAISGPLRTAIHIVDEAGTEHAMAFVFKRYSVGCTRSLSDWATYAQAWAVAHGDIVGFERRDMSSPVLHLTVVQRHSGSLAPLEIAGPVSVVVRLGRADSAAAGWPLRLSSRCAMSLFPEREAACMQQGSTMAPVTATDDSGRQWSMTYQVKPHQGRASETRQLVGWPRLATALEACEGDKIAITRTTEPGPDIEPQLHVSILTRALAAAAVQPSSLLLAEDSNAAWEESDGDTGSPDDEPDATMDSMLPTAAAEPVGIKLTLGDGSGRGRPLRLSRAQAALLLPQMLTLSSDDVASMPCTVVDATGQSWSMTYNIRRYVSQTGVHSTARLLHGWQALAAAWHLQQGDVIGLEQRGDQADTLHICMLRCASHRQQPDLTLASSTLQHSAPQRWQPNPTLGSGGSVLVEGNAQSGRTLHLSRRTASQLFPDLEDVLATELSVRHPITVVDDDGTHWPMVYVAKRYGLTEGKLRAGAYRTLNGFSDFERSWQLQGGTLQVRRVPPPDHAGSDEAHTVMLHASVVNAVSAKSVDDHPGSNAGTPTVAAAALAAPLSVQFSAAAFNNDTNLLPIPLGQGHQLLSPLRQEAAPYSPIRLLVVDAQGKWWKMECEWHRRAGGSPFTELPVPVLAGWQGFADAWHVQEGDTLHVSRFGAAPCELAVHCPASNTGLQSRSRCSLGRAPGSFTESTFPSSIVGPAGACLRLKAEGRNRVLNAPRSFGKLFFPDSEAAFRDQDSIDWRLSIVDPKGEAWDVTYCLRRYRPKGMRRAVCGWAAFDKAWSLQPGDAIGFERCDETACDANAERLSVCVINREVDCSDEALADARAWKGRAHGTAVAAGSSASRVVEGPRAMKLTVASTAMRGRALQVTKAGWALMFPDVEAAFAVADDIAQQIVVIDANGARWPMQYALHRYRMSTGARCTQRRITEWAAFGRAWSITDGDVIGLERNRPPMGEIHAHVLNRQASFSSLPASYFTNGPRTFPTVHGPVGLKVRITSSTLNGRSMTINKRTGITLLPAAEKAFEDSDTVDFPFDVLDAAGQAWPAVYALRRAARTQSMQKQAHVTRTVRHIGDVLRAWAVQEGDTIGMERGDEQQERIGLTVVHRLQPVTVPLPLAAHAPRSSLGSLGSTRSQLLRTIDGPKTVRVRLTASMAASKTLTLSKRLGLVLFPDAEAAFAQPDATAAQERVTLVDAHGIEWPMTMTMRRYGGRGKMVRDSRYLGGWGAFARCWSISVGTCVDFEHSPEQLGRLTTTVTHPAALPSAAEQTVPAANEGQVQEHAMADDAAVSWQQQQKEMPAASPAHPAPTGEEPAAKRQRTSPVSPASEDAQPDEQQEQHPSNQDWDSGEDEFGSLTEEDEADNASLQEEESLVADSNDDEEEAEEEVEADDDGSEEIDQTDQYLTDLDAAAAQDLDRDPG